MIVNHTLFKETSFTFALQLIIITVMVWHQTGGVYVLCET